MPYSLRVTGFTAVSRAKTKEEDDTSAAIIDNLTVTRGRHAIKAGVEVRRVLTNPGSSADGTLTYTSRNSFLSNALDSATVTSTLPLKRLRKTQVFSFLQDEYKMASTFTLNLGVRYSFFNVFHETQGRAVPFDFATCGGLCQPGAEFSSPRTHDVDPRVAFAWAPKAMEGRTVIRSGFGIYHGDGQMEDQNLPASNDVAAYALNSDRLGACLSDRLVPGCNAGDAVAARTKSDRKDEYASPMGHLDSAASCRAVITAPPAIRATRVLISRPSPTPTWPTP